MTGNRPTHIRSRRIPPELDKTFFSIDLNIPYQPTLLTYSWDFLAKPLSFLFNHSSASGKPQNPTCTLLCPQGFWPVQILLSTSTTLCRQTSLPTQEQTTAPHNTTHPLQGFWPVQIHLLPSISLCLQTYLAPSSTFLACNQPPRPSTHNRPCPRQPARSLGPSTQPT